MSIWMLLTEGSKEAKMFRHGLSHCNVYGTREKLDPIA